MDILLTAIEARCLGCLVEKELTTPEYYPLSLNAVVTGCNQKQNRDPVMSLAEGETRRALDALVEKKLVREISGARVPKYAHRLTAGLGLNFGLDRNQAGLLCMLLLRGPQTPGELRGRTKRLCDFSSANALEASLEQLMTNERGPYVTRLTRQAGHKEARYAHLLCGEVAQPKVVEPPRGYSAPPSPEVDPDRLAALEQTVAALEARVAELEAHLSPEDEPQT